VAHWLAPACQAQSNAGNPDQLIEYATLSGSFEEWHDVLSRERWECLKEADATRPFFSWFLTIDEIASASESVSPEAGLVLRWLLASESGISLRSTSVQLSFNQLLPALPEIAIEQHDELGIGLEEWGGSLALDNAVTTVIRTRPPGTPGAIPLAPELVRECLGQLHSQLEGGPPGKITLRIVPAAVPSEIRNEWLRLLAIAASPALQDYDGEAAGPARLRQESIRMQLMAANLLLTNVQSITATFEQSQEAGVVCLSIEIESIPDSALHRWFAREPITFLRPTPNGIAAEGHARIQLPAAVFQQLLLWGADWWSTKIENDDFAEVLVQEVETVCSESESELIVDASIRAVQMPEGSLLTALTLKPAGEVQHQPTLITALTSVPDLRVRTFKSPDALTPDSPDVVAIAAHSSQRGSVLVSEVSRSLMFAFCPREELIDEAVTAIRSLRDPEAMLLDDANSGLLFHTNVVAPYVCMLMSPRQSEVFSPRNWVSPGTNDEGTLSVSWNGNKAVLSLSMTEESRLWAFTCFMTAVRECAVLEERLYLATHSGQ
jgi:hypothetical protein